MRHILLFILLTGLLLSGCSTLQPIKEPAKRQSPAAQVQSQALTRVNTLLAQAERAFSRKRLTTPLDDNAYFRYLQVLSIEPENQAAQLGIQQIVETYLAWSITNIEAGQYRRATDMLNKARSIDEQHPSIEALGNRIARAQTSRKDSFRLDQHELTSRSDAAIGKLHEIGRSAEKHQARVRIVAATDADGRWIYQQLNNASLNRIRATIELGSPPTIQLTYP
jgi:hypothetical protein